VYLASCKSAEEQIASWWWLALDCLVRVVGMQYVFRLRDENGITI
jgi:hypothetical protein